jgi:hypothetical protein
MRTCKYCGKEYSEEVQFCPLDNEPLQESVASPLPPDVSTLDGATVEKKSVLYPDYQWSARDAWKCVGMLLVFDIVIELVLFTLDSASPVFRHWHRTGYGFLSIRVAYAIIWLLTAAYFARTETLATFTQAMGLDRKPTERAWFGIVMALALRIFSHIAYARGWAHGYTLPSLGGFVRTEGLERYFYLASPIMAAFYEEPVMRGFLYKAFRGSYSSSLSTTLIIGVTVWTHWPQYIHSIVAAVTLSALTAVQCRLREKSSSLWDCILSHLVFNVSNPVTGRVFR